MKKRVAVFPAGTEIAHEVFESLKFSKHWELYGANSARDHSELTFRNLRLDLPRVDQPDFLAKVQQIVREWGIDYIVPAHDDAIYALSGQITGAKLVGPGPDLAHTLRFKSVLLDQLRGVIPVPNPVGKDPDFPIFCKPDRGQGSRGARILASREEYVRVQTEEDGLIFQELLPGDEVTVDCFSDAESKVLFCSARVRERVLSGIATRMREVEIAELPSYADLISKALGISGAWFFQMKKDRFERHKLLEVANRLAGSSGFQRAKGINLIDAWLHQLEGAAVKIEARSLPNLIYDRALYPRMSIERSISRIYVDYDDTIILNDGADIHHRLVGLLFGLKVSKKIPITLLTRHAHDVEASLQSHGLLGLFDQVVHIRDGGSKSRHIDCDECIFIDDSFAERNEVARRSGALCIPPESVEILEAFL